MPPALSTALPAQSVFQRRPIGWPEWAITTRIDTAEHWRTCWRAISCHRSQLPAYDDLLALPEGQHRALWGNQGFYRAFGLVANLILIMNVVLLVAVMSLLQAALSLPGIAGIVLTIGMAADANVLIYERIREEIRTGRSAISAIDAGFTRALATIMDSNITTFIAAAVLFFIGTGPVRGFAVTFGIGIITTVFTAFTLTRLMVSYWVRWSRPQKLAVT